MLILPFQYLTYYEIFQCANIKFLKKIFVFNETNNCV